MDERNFKFAQLQNDEKRLFVENIIDNIFNEIESSNRTISVWQAECLNEAINSLASSQYTLTLTKTDMYSFDPSVLANRTKCDIEVENKTVDELKKLFSVSKGYPSRK
jgi:hypothetical protein